MNNYNLLSIRAMHHWVKSNGNTPAPENYVTKYLNSLGVSGSTDLRDAIGMGYEVSDSVFNPTEVDMREEIELLDRNEAVNNSASEDCETMQELSEITESALSNG
jgi:hypothetical protein